MQITVEATVAAPVAEVWRAWTTPADIKQWNAASDDWHTTKRRWTCARRRLLLANGGEGRQHGFRLRRNVHEDRAARAIECAFGVDRGGRLHPGENGVEGAS